MTDDAPTQMPVPFQPEMNTRRSAYIRLALVSGIGPRMMLGLLEHFESPEAVLAATLSQLGVVNRVGPRLASSIREAAQNDLADKVIEHSAANGIRIVLPHDPDFPRLLGELSDPPPILFCRGTLATVDQLSIGIVGTRHPTNYGKTVCQTLARGLARAGLTIVSGLARGIDAEAHRAALEVGGRTVAFLGSSVTDIYPPEHDKLADEITQQGALLSETHVFAKPKSGVFPQRNRLISGFSLGVIVVEAADRSGALITARHAGEQGRDLFAVPGPVTSRMSRGANGLIRDGAILIQDAGDVIDHLGPLVESAELGEGQVVNHPAELQLNEQEQVVLQAIGADATDLDEVIVKSGLPPARVLSTISVLEMRGMIRRHGGRSVSRRR
jgi:DNA processing protein